ncbi:hypothetical protein PT974_07186 [Cladobotryum mycophilum]|uniref:Uncharacterized protein n=1 Tax=Cladobotryum mycophilum TaxID=491253 RepID=A0ABR0SNT6_9HYPO
MIDADPPHPYHHSSLASLASTITINIATLLYTIISNTPAAKMCKKITSVYPCGHQEEQFQPCKSRADNASSANECPKMVVQQVKSSDPCSFDDCKWEEYGGIWRCCKCRKAPNREALCRWSDKNAPCKHMFCESCSPMAPKSQAAKGKGKGKGK